MTFRERKKNHITDFHSLPTKAITGAVDKSSYGQEIYWSVFATRSIRARKIKFDYCDFEIEKGDCPASG